VRKFKYKSNWFKRKVGNPTFVAGSKINQIYELDWGKISFVVAITTILLFVIYIFW